MGDFAVEFCASLLVFAMINDLDNSLAIIFKLDNIR
jgi:hypothetical protein